MERYEIAPQMREYDRLGVTWRPYTMFSQPANYKSDVVNTDGLAQRLSGREGLVSLETCAAGASCSLVVGASTAFGVGATSDKATISSRLSDLTGDDYLSLSGKAYNSRQETILFLEFASRLKNVQRVIIFSGANNLYCSALSDPTAAPFFFSNQFYQSVSTIGVGLKRQFVRLICQAFGIDGIDWKSASKSEILREIRKSAFAQKPSRDAFEAHIDIDAAMNRTFEDLYIWKCLSEAMGFELIFCLQPVAGWCSKDLCVEEEKLFETLNKQTNQILALLSSENVGKVYAQGLSAYCDMNEIKFLDLNGMMGDSKDWLFVDRVHLTDLGYERASDRIHDVIRGA